MGRKEADERNKWKVAKSKFHKPTIFTAFHLSFVSLEK